jgi:hypothetical protein
VQKEIFIVKGLPEEDYTGFKARILALAAGLLHADGPVSLKVTLTERKPPRLSVIPFRKEKVAVFSISGRPPDCPVVLSEAPGFTGGYLVEEAVPVSYDKTWEDGKPSPGACLLTLFHRKPGLDPETFIRRWHGGHTPLSLRLHPLWNYNRNVAISALHGNSTWYDGIVEEHFRTAQELLNPLRFFGPPLRVPYHMFLVYRDTVSFIDMKRIETYLATEIHLRSPRE